ncbi:MAG TPA: efflux RND transporter permease subunit [Candidatus Eremiobacteraceae bacterium]|nr:efflux RND transporter permease subunit [Candidatus Eremiobacteraceae bacterium]
MSIARFAVTRRVAVTMLSAAIVVLGIFAAPRLPVALLPSFAPPVVFVTVLYTNASPETIESTVTRPIENAVSRVSGIDILESTSAPGVSSVRIQFDYGTNIDVAAVDVQQQVARIRASLPNDPALQEPQIIKADPNALPILTLEVTDPARTQRDLSDIINNQLSDELASVHGVGSVSVSGAAQRAIMVQPDEHKLAAIGLTLTDVMNRISNENVDIPAGIIQIGPEEYGIRTSALYKSAADVGDTVIAVQAGSAIRLKDIASVSDSIQEQRVFSRLNGQQSVLLNITAQPDANIVAVANELSAKFADIHKSYPQMHFETMLDQREFILSALASLEHTAIYGAVLAVLIILLFLHSWRSTVIVAVSLPVSILGTLFVAYLLHESLNVMTLGGVALGVGLIVDDAVVVIENISRFLRAGNAPVAAAEKATTQIFTAVLASSITVITVFFPLMLIPGLQGLIFTPFAIVVMSAVGISLLVAVTAVPMLSASILRRRDTAADGDDGRRTFGARFDHGYARFEDTYRRALGFCLDRPRAVLGCAIGLFVIALGSLLAGVVQTEIFPASDSRFVSIGLQTPNGDALARTDAVSRVIESALRKDPRVVAVGSTVGQTGFTSARPITNRATLQVTLQPGTSASAAASFVHEWNAKLSGRSSDPKLRAALAGSIVRGQTIDIVQRQISQGQTALEVELFGPDINRLQALSNDAMSRLAQIPGVGQPDTNVTEAQPEVDVAIDRTKAMMSGLGTGDLAGFIDTATNGSTASFFQVNGIQYPIIVQLPAAQRRSFNALGQLELPAGAANGSGGTTSAGGSSNPGVYDPTGANPVGSGSQAQSNGLTLGSVAALSQGFGPSAISRLNRQRNIEIQAPISGRPLGPILKDAAVVMDGMHLPDGYRWQYGPEIVQGQNSFSGMYLAVGLAILLIYMLLAAQFESYVDPLIIMTSIPLSLVGIISSLLITNRAFGLTAFIGSLMLVGIAVKNAILVVEFTRQLREEGLSARDALMRAGPMRLRPILMTMFATCGGMLPLAFGIEAGSSTQAPLATVVIGGLVTSTFLSLLVVPTLYLAVANRSGGRFVNRRLMATTPTLEREDTIELVGTDAGD